MNTHLLKEYAILCKIAYMSPVEALPCYNKMGYEAKVLTQPIEIEQVYALKYNDILLIVLAGSNQLRDWLRNIFAIPGWYIHSGYSEIATALIDSVVTEYKDSNAKELVLLGHSKGGGIAAILADYLEYLPVSVVSYGAPRIASKSYASTYKHKAYTRVVHPEDPVARLPFEVMGYKYCGVPVVYDGKEYKFSLKAWLDAQKEYPVWKLFTNFITAYKAHNSYWL